MDFGPGRSVLSNWHCVLIFLVFTLCSIMTTTTHAQTNESVFYIGTYTKPGGSQGIYRATLNANAGTFSEPKLAAETANPSFLTIRRDGKFLYSANEVSDYEGNKTGAVSAFSIDHTTGMLTRINDRASGGTSPCYVALNPDASLLLIANYSSGTVQSVRIDPATGALANVASTIQHTGSGPNPGRQKGPHAHSFNFDPTNQYALACDLGIDKVIVYKTDPATGEVVHHSEAQTPPGAGPRHLAFHPNGRFAYVINELTATITVFQWDASAGTLTPVETTPATPPGYDGKAHAAEIQVHPSGQFLYASIRGNNTVALMHIDPATGKLTYQSSTDVAGKMPRHFSLDPSGRFLLVANQDTNNITLFRVNPQDGQLTATSSVLEVPAPVCVKFVHQ
jgi:6-phosphogluconolactonase